MKKKLILLCVLTVLMGIIAGCSGSSNYEDGTYEGRSTVYADDSDGTVEGYGIATIAIQDNEIISCEYHIYQTDGTLKDEDYGKQGGEILNADFYNKAQKAVLACEQYAVQLVETGSPSEVDAVSGATIAYDQFQEAVKDALKQAKK